MLKSPTTIPVPLPPVLNRASSGTLVKRQAGTPDVVERTKDAKRCAGILFLVRHVAPLTPRSCCRDAFFINCCCRATTCRNMPEGCSVQARSSRPKGCLHLQRRVPLLQPMPREVYAWQRSLPQRDSAFPFQAPC